MSSRRCLANFAMRTSVYRMAAGGVSVDRAEVALSVDQQVPHVEVLRHPDQGVVDRHVAVRVVFTDDVPDDARRFFVRLVVEVPELIHRIQDTPVHRLEPVTDVRDGAPDDDAHGVIDVRAPHLVFYVNGRRMRPVLRPSLILLTYREGAPSSSSSGPRYAVCAATLLSLIAVSICDPSDARRVARLADGMR